MNLPTYVGIGTQRGGTTWLYNCLKEHPEVYVSEKKEISYFSVHYDKGLDYYASFFQGRTNELAAGEISPDYMKRKECAARIARDLPDVKIIAVLRNPISRAYSAYMRFAKEKTGLSFEAAIEQREGLLRNGLYYDQLLPYFETFNQENMLILIFEELQNDNLGTIRKVYDFLGVDREYRPSWIGKTTNTTIFPRLTQLMSKLHLAWLIELVKRTPLDPLLRKLSASLKKQKKPRISSKLKKKLIAYYQEPNKKLEKLLGRNLDIWTEI